MKTKTLLLATLLILLLAPWRASAFDGDRKGFLLNLGLGFGQGKLTASALGVSASVDKAGFGTDFKIGGGTSSQVQIYFTHRALWYSPSIGDSISVEGTLVNSMAAAGVSYFLEPQAPSVFFSGALGVGIVSDDDDDGSMSGFGFTLGVGYEFTRNFIAELTFMHSGVSGDNDLDVVDWTISNIMVSVSWLAY